MAYEGLRTDGAQALKLTLAAVAGSTLVSSFTRRRNDGLATFAAGVGGAVVAADWAGVTRMNAAIASTAGAVAGMVAYRTSESLLVALALDAVTVGLVATAMPQAPKKGEPAAESETGP